MVLVDLVDNGTQENNSAWSLRMEELVAEVARARGWNEERVELLVGSGFEELGLVRIEMFPDSFAAEKSNDGAGDDADNDTG